MTGPQHYKEAERLIRQARDGRDTQGNRIDRTLVLREAAIHATLAVAAATALSALDLEYDAWLRVASEVRPAPESTEGGPP